MYCGNSSYEIIRNFVPTLQVDHLIRESNSMITRFYNKHNIEKHIAYPSDKTETRDSYAFAINVGENYGLPAIEIDQLPKELLQVTQIALKKLNISKGRVLFNIQRYWNNSNAVPKHIDGEIFEYHRYQNGDLLIKKMIRPKQVAILTLKNDFIEGGTRLFHGSDIAGTLINYGMGDLLIFDNESQEHAVDAMSLEDTVEFNESLPLRYVIAWRSLEQHTVLLEEEKNTPLTFERAVEMQKIFLKQVWPNRLQKEKKGLF